MTVLFMPLLVLHVVVAALGLGSILSVAVVAASVRTSSREAADASAWLTPLLRFSATSLGVMLVTGILMDVVGGGTFHDRWWFRGSGLLLVITGALHARARRIARRQLGSGREQEAVLRSIERLAYGMSALIAAIAVLMEVKPF